MKIEDKIQANPNIEFVKESATKTTGTLTSIASSCWSEKSSTTPKPTPMKKEVRNDNVRPSTDLHNFFSGCRRDANCGCSICLDNIKSILDLMPLSAQRSSLSKFSSSKPLIIVNKTPIPIDPSLLSTPTSRSCSDSSTIVRSTPKSIVSKRKWEPKRTGNLRESRSWILWRILMCLSLFVVGEFGGFWLVFRVLGPPKLSSVMVERLADRGVGEKIRVLEKGLEGYGLVGEISSCGTRNWTWTIKRDGLILNSQCTIYKSVTEELAIWEWPFQIVGLLTAGFSSRTMTVISGRIIEWENGGIGCLVTRKVSSTWVLTKWSAAAVQFDPNTWVLEYRRSTLLDNPRLFSEVGGFLKFMVSVVIRRAREEFWFLARTSECSLYRSASLTIPRAGSGNIPT